MEMLTFLPEKRKPSSLWREVKGRNFKSTLGEVTGEINQLPTLEAVPSSTRGACCSSGIWGVCFSGNDGRTEMMRNLNSSS